MSYLTLSRRYRPKAFDEILGQDNALTILKSFIQNYSLPHALIFCGSRGVGKTSMARILAKTINCDELLKSGKCKKYDSCSCKEIDENKSIDVIEIDAASNNGVDQIREIIDSSNYSSIRCKYKVFIIDEVHMLSKAAFNALLKTLEEPNKNTIFILATTEVEKIPLTVISEYDDPTGHLARHQIDIRNAESFHATGFELPSLSIWPRPAGVMPRCADKGSLQ